MSDKHLTLELVTPEKVAWSAPADFVVLPAADGEMGVLPGHMSFLVQLGAGEVRETKDDVVSLFAETAEAAEQINAERARQSLERAKAESTKPNLDPMHLAEIE